MRRTADEYTSIGRWLRATQLDEVRSSLDVLRGDMSLVGPRPIRRVFFEELAHDLPAYPQRLIVWPGLTGLAQVRRGDQTSMAEKLAHDLEWIADPCASTCELLRNRLACPRQSVGGLVPRAGLMVGSSRRGAGVAASARPGSADIPARRTCSLASTTTRSSGPPTPSASCGDSARSGCRRSASGCRGTARRARRARARRARPRRAAAGPTRSCSPSSALRATRRRRRSATAVLRVRTRRARAGAESARHRRLERGELARVLGGTPRRSTNRSSHAAATMCTAPG